MKYLYIAVLLAAVFFCGCKGKKDNALDSVQDPNTLREQTEQGTETMDSQQPQTVYVPGEWITDYDAAINYAKELNRPVLMNFTGSDWCSWCFKLRDEVFSKKDFIDYAKDNLILLTVDFPKRKQLPLAEQQANDALAMKYGVNGYPTIVFVDSTGKELNRSGYQPGGASAYVKLIQNLIKQQSGII